ncbi:TPA: hypothetical protein NIA45_004637 [Pseudomonas aeruginosa]|nr:hypothetical protein [Pseudomonas aeruginosa]
MDASTATDTPLTQQEVEELYPLLPYGDSINGVSIEGDSRKVSGLLMLAGSVRGLLALMRQREQAHKARETELLALLEKEAGLIPTPSQSGTVTTSQA